MTRGDERLQVLFEAMRAFAEASTDYERLLDLVARRLSEVIKDSCVLFLLSADGASLVPNAVHAPDEASLRETRELLAGALVLADHAAAQRLVATGEPIFVPHVDAEAMRADTVAEYTEFQKRAGIHSLLCVALRVRERTIGMLSMSRFRPESPPFDAVDRGLAQSLADHAALAIANSRAYAAEREAREAAERSRAALLASQDAHRQMFEKSPVPTFLFHTETKHLLDANQAAVELYGYASRDEFVKLALDDLRAPDDAAALASTLTALGDEDSLGVARHRRRDGTVFYVEGRTHVSSFGGERARFVTVTDVTERFRAAEALDRLREARASESLFRGMLEAAPDAVIIVDQLGSIVLLNHQTEKSSGTRAWSCWESPSRRSSPRGFVRVTRRTEWATCTRRGCAKWARRWSSSGCARTAASPGRGQPRPQQHTGRAARLERHSRHYRSPPTRRAAIAPRGDRGFVGRRHHRRVAARHGRELERRRVAKFRVRRGRNTGEIIVDFEPSAAIRRRTRTSRHRGPRGRRALRRRVAAQEWNAL